MQTFLARCCLLALLAAGFLMTGDAARVSRLVGHLIGSRDIPRSADHPAPSAAGPLVSGHENDEPPSAAGTAVLPLGPLDMGGPPDAPMTRPIPAPPKDGPRSVSLGTLDPGARVHVWIGHPGKWLRHRPVEVIRLDVIDPVRGEVLEYRHCAPSASDDPGVPPRRVRVPSGFVTTDQDLERVPTTTAHDGPTVTRSERCGPVLAIAVEAR